MNNSCVEISLDLKRTAQPVVVRAEKGDTARKLRVRLADGGKPYTITDDCYAVFTAKKPDGTSLYNDCQIVNGIIEYQFTEQTCSAAGSFPAQIRVYGGDGRLITTVPFQFEVYDTVFTAEDAAKSVDEQTALDTLVSRAQNICSTVEQKLANGEFVGPPGKEGPPGTAGKDGAPGIDGAPGREGPPGREGSPGAAGKPGRDGRDGKDGAPGRTGDTGKQGEPGKSAYEVALENGFVGTPEAWLKSLHGKNGQDGPPGSPGKPGATGGKGRDGASAYDIAVQNGFVGSQVDWLASLIGPQGKTGPTGSTGATGAHGESAYEIAKRYGYANLTEEEWALAQSQVLIYGPKAVNAALVAKNAAEQVSGDVLHIDEAVPHVDQAVRSSAESAKRAADSATSASQNAQKTGEDRTAVKGTVEAVQASVNGVAQEPTAQKILEQQQKANKFLENMEAGGGDAQALNGFSLKLGPDRTVVLSYTDPVSGVEYSPATLPTESTAQQIIVERKKINKQLHLAAVAVEGDVE